MAKLTKNLTAAYGKFNNEQKFTAEAAIKQVKDNSFEKFDTSIDLSINMNLDTTQADQQLRGSIVLPNGTGKTAKVLVVAEADDQTAAKAAGADHTGGIEIMEKVKNEN
jgi:large subunit ribosomal protein L1